MKISQSIYKAWLDSMTCNYAYFNRLSDLDKLAFQKGRYFEGQLIGTRDGDVPDLMKEVCQKPKSTARKADLEAYILRKEGMIPFEGKYTTSDLKEYIFNMPKDVAKVDTATKIKMDMMVRYAKGIRQGYGIETITSQEEIETNHFIGHLDEVAYLNYKGKRIKSIVDMKYTEIAYGSRTDTFNPHPKFGLDRSVVVQAIFYSILYYIKYKEWLPFFFHVFYSPASTNSFVDEDISFEPQSKLILIDIDQEGVMFNEIFNLFRDSKEKKLGIWEEIEKPSYTTNPSVCAKCPARFTCEGRQWGSEEMEVLV
jgi:hypothetical protein